MAAGEERQREMSRRFGENVRRHRERRGMSQADLAREMATRGWAWHQSTAYKIEHGGRRTDAYEVHDLAEILGVGMDRLFWSGAEAKETAMVDRSAAILHRAWEETADAVARLYAATDGAERTLTHSGDSKYERVREACADLTAELDSSTLDAAVGEGAARWEREAEGCDGVRGKSALPELGLLARPVPGP